MIRKYLLLVHLMAAVELSAQEASAYFGLEAPDAIPEKFAPGTISMPLEYEFGSVFSKDGNEFYYGVDVGGRNEIRYCSLQNGKWSEPEVILADDKFGFNDPMLSNDEQRLYFISNKPVSGTEAKDIDIWYVQKTARGWSDPINAGPNINSDRHEYYISFAQDGSMYFASNVEASEDRLYNHDIYRSAFVNGEFQKPERLSFNSDFYEADVYVSPDESYVIFCAIKKEGFGQGDLYISFQQNGSWTEPQNMGEPINDPGHQLCPFVTADGRYFLFTSNRDIYWVNASIIKNYRPD